jgi:hypothetical protein
MRKKAGEIELLNPKQSIVNPYILRSKSKVYQSAVPKTQASPLRGPSPDIPKLKMPTKHIKESLPVLRKSSDRSKKNSARKNANDKAPKLPVFMKHKSPEPRDVGVLTKDLLNDVYRSSLNKYDKIANQMEAIGRTDHVQANKRYSRSLDAMKGGT